MFLWFTNIPEQNVLMTDQILGEKAKQFAEKLDVDENEFKFSNGWLSRFKAHHSISNKVISGESGELQSDIVKKARKKIAESLFDFELKNIFNMDETALFFKMLPDRSLTIDSKTKGVKKMKDRLSIAFACNADGSEKLKPFVIGKTLKPRCFKNFCPDPYVSHKANKKAWMTATIFESWIRDVDCSMRL